MRILQDDTIMKNMKKLKTTTHFAKRWKDKKTTITKWITLIEKLKDLIIISEIATLTNDDNQSTLFNKWYRSIKYWNELTRISANRWTFAIATIASRSRTFEFVDVCWKNISRNTQNRRIQDEWRNASFHFFL
jgi:hypothetical protein